MNVDVNVLHQIVFVFMKTYNQYLCVEYVKCQSGLYKVSVL